MKSGQEIVAELMEKGYSKYRIAKELNVSYNTIVLWQKGVYSPRAERMEKINELLQ